MLTFSELYLRPKSLQEDSERMRIQLAAAFAKHVSGSTADRAYDLLVRATGAQVPTNYGGPIWSNFFKKGELRDILDLITFADIAMRRSSYDLDPSKWRSDVQFVFDRQHMRYRVDDDGVVRLRVDEAFEMTRIAALSGLSIPRYGAAKTELEGAYRALAASAPDGKQAVRSIFEAIEIVFKLSFPEARRIGAPEIGKLLSPHVAARYRHDRPALEAGARLVNQLVEWVAAAQFYRHGQAQEEPNQPPLETAILLLSSGTSHLRWLIELDPGRPLD